MNEILIILIIELPCSIPVLIPFPLLVPPIKSSCVRWDEARGQAASDRGEPREEEEGGAGPDAAGEAGARQRRVGADPDGDRGPPTHQRSGLQLETEAQVHGEL